MLDPGTTFGRYRVVSALGQGGSGEVYRAYDPQLRREVALKILGAEGGLNDASPARQLLAEARAAAGLRHPSIVAIHDVGESDGVFFVVMDLAPGETLRARLRKGLPSQDDAIRWARALASALAAAHEAGFVHRDVKPENVMVDGSGAASVLTLLDFGIARSLVTARADGGDGGDGGVDDEVRTAEGKVRGTPLYMAPEALAGAAPSALSDQFAWGLVVYEMLAGSRARRRAEDDSFDVYAEPEPLLARAPTVPPAIARLVHRALERRPAARWDSMRTVLLALDDAVSGAGAVATTEAVPEPALVPPPSAPRRSRRYLRAAAIALGLVTVTLLAGLGLRKRLSRRAPSVTPSVTLPTNESYSDRPAALDAYRQGLAALRAGSPDLVEHFERAVALDPLFAAAHLRLALYVDQWDLTTARAHYRTAKQLEPRLDARDHALLVAAEPRLALDSAMSAQRFDALAASFPGDAEFQYYAAQAHIARGELLPSADAAARALAIDPGFGAARGIRVEALAYSGAFSQALVEGASCGALPDCLYRRMWILSARGECEELATEATRAMTAGADVPQTRKLLADALATTGKIEAAKVVLADAAAHESEAPVRERMVARDGARFAMLAGDFAAAEKSLRVWLQLSEGLPDLGHHGMPVEDLLALLEETGDRAGAAAVAEDFLAHKDAWTLELELDDDALRLDMTPRALAAAWRGGRRSRAWFDEQRGAWETRMRSLAPPFSSGYIWMFGETASVTNAEEAEVAMKARGAAVVPLYRPRENGLERLGETMFLAGHEDEGLSLLHEAATSCSVARDPVGNTRAHDEYGQALESSGDPDQLRAACAEYAVVLARWGSATPRSLTAEHARGRFRALGCEAKAGGR